MSRFDSKFIPSSDLSEFLVEARERYAAGLSADADDRRDAQEDQRFESGGLNQWNKLAVEARSTVGFERPILTENRLHIYVQQVVNDGRQSKPSIVVAAMDGGKKETAEAIQARIRHLEYASDADIAYDHSREQQIISGRGFYRIKTDYDGDMSFRQVPRLERIENQFSVVFDPNARRYDRSDANWCFVISYISRQQHAHDYPDSKAQLSAWFTDQPNPAPGWQCSGTDCQQIQIAEYWRKEPGGKKKLVQLEDGKVMWASDIAVSDTNPASVSNPTPQVVQSRMVEMTKVRQYILNGVEILDEEEFIVPYIPIIPVWGREEWVDGQRHTISLIRHAKDPQRLVNLYVSNIAEQIAQLPKQPYTIAEGQISGHEQEWREANTVPRAALVYKPQAVGNVAVPPPQRNVQEPPIQALTVGLNQAIDAIKASMGMFDQSLGAGPTDQSGIAIQRRKRQADNANFHFHDNEARSRKYAGTIILALMAKLDKDAKVWTVRGEDGSTRQIPLGQEHIDELTGQATLHEIAGMDNAYDVNVRTGPSYASAREEAFDKFSTMAQAWPQLMQVAGDLVLEQSDVPGAAIIAERLKKALPPALQPPQKGQVPLPPEVQQAQQQATFIIKNLSEVNDKLQKERDNKILELENDRYKANLAAETQRIIAAVNAKVQMTSLEVKSNMHQLDMSIDAIQHSAEMAGDQAQRELDALEMSQSNGSGAPASAPPATPAAPTNGLPSPQSAPGAAPNPDSTGVPQ